MERSRARIALPKLPRGQLFIPAVICAFLANLPALGASQTETITQVASVTSAFPPKPDGLTNAPTIKTPIISIPDNLVRKLGGPDATNLAIPFIENLLIKSGRFTLSYAEKPKYQCFVKLSDLQIKRVGSSSSSGGGFGMLTNFLRIKLNGQPTKLDLSQDKQELSVLCSVSIQVMDSESKAVVAAGDGTVDKTDTIKNLNTELAGLASGSTVTNEVTTNTVQFETRVIELASYYGLTNMLTQLDPVLLKSQSSPAVPTETAAATDTAAPEQRMKKLKQLLDAGVIDQQDYDKKKKEILDAL